MAHYAILNEENIVTFIFVGKDENDFETDINNWEDFYGAKRTSYNTKGGIHYKSNNSTPSEDQTKSFRKNYAGIGYTYDDQRDAFIPPKPFPSWVLDEFTCLWDSPIPYPNDGNMYYWDENGLLWVIVEI